MPLPFKFHPAEQAKSSEVSQNFEYIMGVLGPNSTKERIDTDAELRLGFRGNVLMTGEHDKADADEDQKFFQIGWNADWNFVNGAWKFSRFAGGEPASAIRIGHNGIEFMT